MSFWRIVLKSLKRHRFSNGLAAISIAAGIALLVAIYSFKEQSRHTFNQVGLGVDAILGPKGSPLQIVLNSLYHLEDMPGKIPWTSYKEVERKRIVAQAIPFVVGHSYGGFRVNAIDGKFLTDFEYLPGKAFSFSPSEGGKGLVLKEPFSSPAPHLEGHHLSGQYCAPKTGATEKANRNIPIKQSVKHFDFFHLCFLLSFWMTELAKKVSVNNKPLTFACFNANIPCPLIRNNYR